MKKYPILITESSLHFKRGQLIESEYKEVDDGIEVNENFIPNSKLVRLTENLSREDQKVIRDMIRQQLKLLFWNMYTKQSVIIGNLL